MMFPSCTQLRYLARQSTHVYPYTFETAPATSLVIYAYLTATLSLCD